MPPTRRLATALVAGAAVAGLTAGCGGPGGLDRAEVVARGDRACGEAEDRIESLTVPSGAAGEQRWRRQVADVQDDLRRRLGALRDESPSELAEPLGRALDALDDQVAALRAGDGDDAALARAEEAAVQARDAFADAGFEVCGRAT